MRYQHDIVPVHGQHLQLRSEIRGCVQSETTSCGTLILIVPASMLILRQKQVSTRCRTFPELEDGSLFSADVLAMRKD